MSPRPRGGRDRGHKRDEPQGYAGIPEGEAVIGRQREGEAGPVPARGEEVCARAVRGHRDAVVAAAADAEVDELRAGRRRMERGAVEEEAAAGAAERRPAMRAVEVPGVGEPV